MNQTLEARVALLERSARRWRWTACGLAVAGLAAVTVGATATPAVQDLLRVHRLEVVTDDGRTAVTITAQADGGMVTIKSPDNPNDEA